MGFLRKKKQEDQSCLLLLFWEVRTNLMIRKSSPVSGGSTLTVTQLKVSLKNINCFSPSSVVYWFKDVAFVTQVQYSNRSHNRPVTMIAFSSETAASFSSVIFSNRDDIRTIQNDIKCTFSGSSGTIFREILIERLSFTWCRAEVGSIVQILHRWAWSELFSLTLLRVLPYLCWWSVNYR